MDLGTVSSDDMLASYRRQLSDAHHRISILEAQLALAEKIFQEVRQYSQGNPEESG